MAIVTKPSNIYQEYENVYQLSVAELLLHPKVSPDSYFNDQNNWKTVFLVYEAPNSNQREMVEFFLSEGPSTGLFEVTEFSRGSYQVKALIIVDFDNGYLRLEREDIDFATLDIAVVLPPPNIDPEPPTLTFVNISPVTADASNNEVITLTFTGSEDLQNVTATIAGQTANVSGAGTSWTATYMLTGTEPAGLVSFSIDFQDLDSNSGATVTGTTDGSSCTIEYASVGLAAVSITSTSGQNAVEGDTITVSFASSNTIQNVSSTIVGKVANVTNTGDNDWEATYVLTASETQGQATFTIDYQDQFGNPQTQVTSVTDGSQVIVDTILPTLSPVTISSNNVDPTVAETGDIITVNFTSSETIQNVTSTIAGQVATVTNISGDNWKAEYTVQSGDPSGVVAFTIDFEDTHGNQGTTVNSITSGSNVTIQVQTSTNLIDTLNSSGDLTSTYLGFGNRSVATDGEYVLIGAAIDGGSNNNLNYAGEAYLFKINTINDTLTFIQTINSPDESQDQRFGYNLDIKGNYIAISGTGSQLSGTHFDKVYVYELDKNNDTISLLQTLKPSGLPLESQFGTCISIDGNYIAISDLDNVYIYKIDNGVLNNNPVNIITQLDIGFTATNDPASVIYMHDNYIAIGGGLYSNNTGIAKVYKLNTLTDTVTSLGYLNSPTMPSNRFFGFDISMDSDYILISSSGLSNEIGAVVVYKIDKNNDTISLIDIIDSPNQSALGGRFGGSTSIHNNNIIISARHEDGSTGLLSNAGACYRYEIDPLTDNITLVTSMYPNSEQAGDQFGYAVNLYGNYTVISAPLKNSAQGVVYIYKIT